METWTEYAVHFRAGDGHWRTVEIPGPEPMHVGQFCRKTVDGKLVADMDALRERTVHATKWRRPSSIKLEALERKS